MAQCGYSSLIEYDTTCGPHWKYPKDVECIALKDCKKDATSHLRFCNLLMPQSTVSKSCCFAELVSVSIFFNRCSLYMFILNRN